MELAGGCRFTGPMTKKSLIMGKNRSFLVRTSHVMSTSFWLSLISVNAPAFALHSATFFRTTCAESSPGE